MAELALIDTRHLRCSSPEANEFQWRLSNGLWALFIAFGTVLSALKVEQARSWRFFNLPVRSFLADYGVTLAVVVWSCLSYALQGAPPGVPRRLALPNTWQVKRTWTVANVTALPMPPPLALPHWLCLVDKSSSCSAQMVLEDAKRQDQLMRSLF